MSAAIATEQAVEGAVAVLERSGRSITSDNVIEVLGGGSKSTVARLLRERRARSNPQSADETFPIALLDSARPMLAALYEMACTTEQDRYRQSSERLHALMNGLEDELEAARQNEERLEAALEQASARQGEQDAQLASYHDRLEASEQQAAAAEQAAAHSQSAYVSMRSKLERVETDLASALNRETRLMRTLETLAARQGEQKDPTLAKETDHETS